MTKTAPKPCDSPSKAETVEIVHSVYQPSKEELEADMRVDATFDEAVEALTKFVTVRRVIRPAQDD